MHRAKLFAGIDLDERARSACMKIVTRLQAQGLNARYESREKLHITLAFLGWVEPERIDASARILRETAAQCAPFSLTLDRIGAFPHERKPRIVWIGSRDQGPAFRGLALSLRANYAQAGLAFEKDAIAHVTIARVKAGAAHLPMLDVTPVRLRVTDLTLFESLPAGRTTRYEVRERARLQGRRERSLE